MSRSDRVAAAAKRRPSAARLALTVPALGANILADLDPAFREKVESVLAACAAAGTILRAVSGIRSPWQQAKLWRQSRAREEIARLIATLLAAKAAWLARVVEEVGPQTGRPVTNAPPGKSAHQYSLAVDCVPIRNGRMDWADMAGFRVFAREARAQGLIAGLFWKSFPDAPHVQDPSMDGIGRRDWGWIDAEMERRWGNTPRGQFDRP